MMGKDAGKAYARARRREERLRRDAAVYVEFMELWGRHGGLASRWGIAGLVAAYHGINPVTARDIVKRMGGRLEPPAT